MAAALGLLVAELAVAQGDPALEVNVADCVKIESPAERFRCYERRVDSALREQSSSREQPPASPSARLPASPPVRAIAPPAASQPAGRASPSASGRESVPERVPERDIAVGGQAAVSDDFGIRRADEGEEKEEERSEEIFSTITDLRETVPNSYLITLENGQVWRQKVPKRHPLRPGQEVRVYSSRFGYRLAAEELNGFIQVERAR